MTIKKLARLAGVGPTTVSNVLHGQTHKMRAETLERVRGILEETKYTPNMGGRLLANYGSRLIGVIMTYSRRNELNVSRDPFHGELIGALEQAIRTGGYFMMLYTSANTEESLRLALSWNVEGIIILGSHADDCARFMRAAAVPLVFIDSYFHDDGIPYVNVGLEDRRGAYLMTRHLIGKGHRRIAFLAVGPSPEGVDYERLCGFREALAEEDIPQGTENFIPLSYAPGERHGFFRVFAQERVRNYTALFFASDFLAVDAMGIFHDMGLSVPEDISLAGFDGNIFSTQCRPRLATVRQDVPEKAVHAVAQVLRIIRKEPMEERDIRLGVSLCPGDSVKDLTV